MELVNNTFSALVSWHPGGNTLLGGKLLSDQRGRKEIAYETLMTWERRD